MQENGSLFVNQQVQCIVTLSNDLQTGFDPINFCGLEELGLTELT